MSSVIAWVVSVGFPTIATYKALKSNDLSQMRPWLMYWAVLQLLKTAETILSPILNYVLFYSWIRILLAVWLVSHGAVELWNERIDPFMASYEPDLDTLLTRIWARLQGAGGQQPNTSAAAAAPSSTSASIFSMFSRPVSSDLLIEALAKTWKAPASTEQVSKQRSYLQAMLNALDKETEEFVAVDNVPPVTTARKGWFW